jgi:hypothetical protein
VRFTDIFEEGKATAEGVCRADFRSIHTTIGHECLRVMPRMEQAAALLGATTEFAGNEGLTCDVETGTIYIASSGIGDGMSEGELAIVGRCRPL